MTRTIDINLQSKDQVLWIGEVGSMKHMRWWLEYPG